MKLAKSLQEFLKSRDYEIKKIPKHRSYRIFDSNHNLVFVLWHLEEIFETQKKWSINDINKDRTYVNVGSIVKCVKIMRKGAILAK